VNISLASLPCWERLTSLAGGRLVVRLRGLSGSRDQENVGDCIKSHNGLLGKVSASNLAADQFALPDIWKCLECFGQFVESHSVASGSMLVPNKVTLCDEELCLCPAGTSMLLRAACSRRYMLRTIVRSLSNKCWLVPSVFGTYVVAQVGRRAFNGASKGVHLEAISW